MISHRRSQLEEREREREKASKPRFSALYQLLRRDHTYFTECWTKDTRWNTVRERERERKQFRADIVNTYTDTCLALAGRRR